MLKFTYNIKVILDITYRFNNLETTLYPNTVR